MESLDRVKKQLQALAMKAIGHNVNIPVLDANQKKALLAHAEILNYPQHILEPAQILDPDDPRFMQFIYMAGFDPWGSGPWGGSS